MSECTSNQVHIESLPVSALALSRRTENALIRAHIYTVGDLQKKTHKELLTIRHLGMGSVNEVQDALAQLQTALQTDSPEFDFIHLLDKKGKAGYAILTCSAKKRRRYA